MCHWSPIGEDGCPLSKWPIGLVQAKIRFYVHCNRTHVAHKIPHQDDHICKKWWNIKVQPCSVVCRTFGHFNPKVRGMIRYFFETREKWIYIKLIYAFFAVDYANSLMTTLLGFFFDRNYFFRQSDIFFEKQRNNIILRNFWKIREINLQMIHHYIRKTKVKFKFHSYQTFWNLRMSLFSQIY